MIKPSPLKDKAKTYVNIPSGKRFYSSEDVAAAVAFYNEYKSEPRLLHRRKAEYREQVKPFIKQLNDCDCRSSELEILDDYNDWLIDTAFEDVVEVKD